MRFVVSAHKAHSEICAAVTWSPDSSLFSCADDKSIVRWSTDGDSSSKVGSTDAFVASMAWFPGVGKQVR